MVRRQATRRPRRPRLDRLGRLLRLPEQLHLDERTKRDARRRQRHHRQRVRPRAQLHPAVARLARWRGSRITKVARRSGKRAGVRTYSRPVSPTLSSQLSGNCRLDSAEAYLAGGASWIHRARSCWARLAAAKSTRSWVPSQNGFVLDWPQRQSAIVSPASNRLPSASRRVTLP